MVVAVVAAAEPAALAVGLGTAYGTASVGMGKICRRLKV